ncbi:hypothetical protein TIFTF001_010032 [Ficus carica]|uniref:Plastidal glycolate/glycerate translocator 1, chloroplastic n=1 Tax=Ficus carica TaxID=3494 RepID=A0AA87ZPA6_FICCA|nr:hypothetical protein TIFTF001_010032 [Ficus carica]
MGSLSPLVSVTASSSFFQWRPPQPLYTAPDFSQMVSLRSQVSAPGLFQKHPRRLLSKGFDFYLNAPSSGNPMQLFGLLDSVPRSRKWVLGKLPRAERSWSNRALLRAVALPRSPKVFGILHLVVSLGIILAMDKFLKKVFVAAAIKFPSALFGMFCIFSVLVILDSTIPAAVKSVMDFFEPALLFIQRWLPLFYVPSLVVLPLSVKDIPAASGIKICYITVGGWLATLCVAGFSAIAVRNLVKTEMVDAEPMTKPSPFSAVEIWSWSGVLVITFVAALLYPTVLGTAARTCLPFLLASTVLGYMVGSGLPSGIKKVFHPIICCTLSADLTAYAFGYFSRSGLDPVLGYYLTKAASNPGAGDVLMGFLGSVILSFAFSMFKQRKLVKRHAAEIFTSVIVSTVFSLYSTALVGRLVGYNKSIRILQVQISNANRHNHMPYAHGLGTAALSANEPEALPFCAIAYALNGIFGSVLCSIPAVRQSLLAVVG